MSNISQFSPGLAAEYTNIVRIVEAQIETLSYKAWRRHEVVQNLEKLCHDLAIQAAWDDIKPRSHLIGYAQFQRFCTTLRLCLPEAILALTSDWTSYEIDDQTFEWEGEYEIEQRAILILKRTICDARSTEWYVWVG